MPMWLWPTSRAQPSTSWTKQINDEKLLQKSVDQVVNEVLNEGVEYEVRRHNETVADDFVIGLYSVLHPQQP